MRKRTSFVRISVFLTLFLVSAACAVNPVTGKRELSLISEQGEISLGQESDKEIRAQYGVYDDPNWDDYMKQVGQRLAPYTHRSHLTYYFAVLDTPVVNAFAVPGGYIYFTRGVLALMNSEAELAAVMAHEMGHVNARHSIRKMSQLILVQLGLVVGSALSETFAKISGVASIGIQLLFLKFSRDDERQADALGVEYSRKGGYNPAEMVSFFHSLEKLGDLSGGHRLPGFLSTHPLTSERVQNTSRMVINSDAQLDIKRPDYLNRLDNIIYGDDPRQGFVEGQAFYHPSLRFSFSFPSGWNVENSPAQVILTAEDGNAAVILQAEKSAESVRAYGQKKAELIEGRRFLDERDLTINSMDSYIQYFDIEQEQNPSLRVILSCIRKDELIYSFSALSSVDDFGKYDFQFGTIVGSFKTLSDPEYLDRQPMRLRVVQASGGQSLQTIFQDAGMEKDLWSQFSIMNGMELSEAPQKGQLIKILR